MERMLIIFGLMYLTLKLELVVLPSGTGGPFASSTTGVSNLTHKVPLCFQRIQAGATCVISNVFPHLPFGNKIGQ